MDHLFFLVSGENPTLPFSEAKSILEAEGFTYQVVEQLTQVLRLKTDPRCTELVKYRSAMTKSCGTEIFNCRAEVEQILKELGKIDAQSVLGEEESFAVRITRVRESSLDIEASALERKIGETIFETTKKAKVDLNAPEKTFIGILTDNRFIFGIRTAEIKHGEYIKRGPRRKSFFHPTAMPAKIARCMVNLAQPRKGDMILDPFCGTGSFLVEAALIGCRVLGFDIERYMVEGSRRNLQLFSIDAEGLAVADAQSVPLAKMIAKSVVTDPPYGTSASTSGSTTRDLVRKIFSDVGDTLEEGGRICLAAPKTIRVPEIGEQTGFRHIESHFIYVHRRLTREIAVFKKS